MNKPKLLFIGKGGAREGMGHLVRIRTMVTDLSPHYDISVLSLQDSFGDFFFKKEAIDVFTYRDNRGMYRFLEKSGRYAVIIVDIYRISIDVLHKIEQYCERLINFDDMQRRIRHRINGAFICPQEPFNNEVSMNETTLTVKGTDYFPLRDEFRKVRQQAAFRRQVSTVGVILGGVPTQSYTLELIRLLDRILEPAVEISVVMGYKPGDFDTQDFSSRVNFLKNVEQMGAFIAKLDVGIIAGGFIKFEMMCIGTPFMLVSLCEHQHRLARKFSADGCGVYLGKIAAVLGHTENTRRKIERFISDTAGREKMFHHTRRLVDGRGGERILELVKNQYAQVTK
jgi:spore coat polysaccharide biosynthesis predicted glycosyltransferase SpsG